MVGLKMEKCGTGGGGLGDRRGGDVGESFVTVDVRFAGSKEVYVGSVEEEDGFCGHVWRGSLFNVWAFDCGLHRDMKCVNGNEDSSRFTTDLLKI
jgi:hypothetical protein